MIQGIYCAIILKISLLHTLFLLLLSNSIRENHTILGLIQYACTPMSRLNSLEK